MKLCVFLQVETTRATSRCGSTREGTPSPERLTLCTRGVTGSLRTDRTGACVRTSSNPGPLPTLSHTSPDLSQMPPVLALGGVAGLWALCRPVWAVYHSHGPCLTLKSSSSVDESSQKYDTCSLPRGEKKVPTMHFSTFTPVGVKTETTKEWQGTVE